MRRSVAVRTRLLPLCKLMMKGAAQSRVENFAAL